MADPAQLAAGKVRLPPGRHGLPRDFVAENQRERRPDFSAGAPAVARFSLVEPLAAGGEIAARYRDAMQLLAELLRPDTGPSGVDAEVRDQALMGGIATLIRRRLNA